MSSLRAHPLVRRLLLALLSGLLIGGLGFLLDHVLHSAERLLASDFYTSAIAFVLSYLLLEREHRRRASLARRMVVAAEVNHHIRNALTGVVFTAAVQNDPALEAVLRDATQRIDWVLNTVLPDGADELRWPVQSAAWQPSPWTTGMENAASMPAEEATTAFTCDTDGRHAGHADPR